MRFKVKDIGEEGLELRVPVTAKWLEVECPDLNAVATGAGIFLTGRLQSSGGSSFLLRGKISGALGAGCSRCLEPAEIKLDFPVMVSYVEADGESKDEEESSDNPDVLPYTDGVIDLTDEVRDEILLALPIGPLCRPDCAGICSVCGGNRNATPCDCEELQRKATSKFGVLKDLKV